jgi:dinuclear metal center YbgI/SA1388 family protein
MKATLADIIKIMETIAPAHLAEGWDNVGLQVGETSWPIKKIWISLDPTPDVVSAACDEKVSLLITHHPLIFNALKKIDFNDSIGKIIQLAGKQKLAIYSAHTNLDNACNGINDILAKKIGLENVTVLKPSNTDEMYKLVVFTPKSYKEKVLETFITLNEGEINNVTQCPIMCNDQEIFIRGDDTKTSVSATNSMQSKEAVKIETAVRKKNLSMAIDYLFKMHPNGIMSYDIIPIRMLNTDTGTGRIGKLNGAVRLSSFANHIRKQFGTLLIKVAGEPNLLINRVAVCSGSGASLIPEFVASGAQVFVSGDVRYHDARVVEQAGLGVVDIGHFVSEYVIVDELKQRLRKILSDKHIDASVESCDLEKEPFWSPANL